MAATLLLDVAAWDLGLDASGSIAVAAQPYSLAQDAASAIRLVKGEYWYDTTQGVPYFDQIFGKLPPLALLRAKFTAAALTVPGVVAAQCFFSSFNDRQLSGQVQVTDSSGRTSIAGF